MFTEECGGGVQYSSTLEGGSGVKVRARRLVYASGTVGGAAVGESRVVLTVEVELLVAERSSAIIVVDVIVSRVVTIAMVASAVNCSS